METKEIKSGGEESVDIFSGEHLVAAAKRVDGTQPTTYKSASPSEVLGTNTTEYDSILETATLFTEKTNFMDNLPEDLSSPQVLDLLVELLDWSLDLEQQVNSIEAEIKNQKALIADYKSLDNIEVNELELCKKEDFGFSDLEDFMNFIDSLKQCCYNDQGPIIKNILWHAYHQAALINQIVRIEKQIEEFVSILPFEMGMVARSIIEAYPPEQNPKTTITETKCGHKIISNPSMVYHVVALLASHKEINAKVNNMSTTIEEVETLIDDPAILNTLKILQKIWCNLASAYKFTAHDQSGLENYLDSYNAKEANQDDLMTAHMTFSLEKEALNYQLLQIEKQINDFPFDLVMEATAILESEEVKINESSYTEELSCGHNLPSNPTSNGYKRTLDCGHSTTPNPASA